MLTTPDWPSVALWLARVLLLGTVWFTLAAGLLAVFREPARRVMLCGVAMLGGLAIPVLLALLPSVGWSLLPESRINLARLTPTTPPPAEVPARSLDEIRNLPRVRQPAGEASTAPGNAPWFPTVSGEPPSMHMAPSTGPEDLGVSEPPSQPTIARADVDASVPSTRWRSPNWIALAVFTYAVGASALGAWYVAGLLGLARLIRRARPAPPEVESVWTNDCAAGTRTAALLVSDSASQPIACWLGEPCVVIPASWIAAPRDRLAWALAHEAEHIRRRDFWIWQGANVARILFWCHPLAWWLRRELRLAQDHLADAAAARQASGAVDYAEFLTQSAQAGLGRIPLVGLGLFGRRSDLYRRVAMLLKRERPLESRAPRWWSVSLVAAGIVVLVATATIRVVAEPPVSPKVVTFSAPQAANGTGLPSISQESFDRNLGRPDSNPSAVPASRHNAARGPYYSPDAAAAAFPPISPSNPAIAGSSIPAFSPRSLGELADSGAQLETKTGASPPPASVEKLKLENGSVEPEPGVVISIVSLMDSYGVSWHYDGSPVNVGPEGGPGGFGGSGFGGAGSMPMGGPGMSMPGGYPGGGGYAGGEQGAKIPANSRTRAVTVHVRRPGPSGLLTSVDGQSGHVSSSQLAEPKVRQIVQTAYWPDEQMSGSVGVRFASKNVARELVATRREGEVFRNKAGETEAEVGPWTDGTDLRTTIRLDRASPEDPRFVVTAVAEDVDGTLHPGRLESSQDNGPPRGRRGGFGRSSGGMPGGMPSAMMGEMMGMVSNPQPEWSMVFPHLPASRIQKIRITWHPYAWVIFRNVSLEADYKTTPTAELFLDKSAPPVMPKEAPVNEEPGTDPTTRTSLRRLGDAPDGVNLPIRVMPSSDAAALQPDAVVTLFVTFERNGKSVTEPLVRGAQVVATNLKLPQDRIAHVLRLDRDEADFVNLAQRVGTVTMSIETDGDESPKPNESLKSELETLAGETADATVLR